MCSKISNCATVYRESLSACKVIICGNGLKTTTYNCNLHSCLIVHPEFQSTELELMLQERSVSEKYTKKCANTIKGGIIVFI